MEITCFACQQKLHVADSSAGQMVRCPTCGATFQAPSLPGVVPLPVPAPMVTPASAVPASTGPALVTPGLAAAAPNDTAWETPPSAPSQIVPMGDYTKGFTITLRQHIVTLVPPIGLILLFVLSFFSWRYAAPVMEGAPLNLWQLAFSGFAVYIVYLLLLIITVPVIFFMPFHERKLLPAPARLHPFIPWAPAAVVVLTLVAWIFFLIDYVECTFVEPIDPTTIWMKLAFRLHTLIVMAAILDLSLVRRRPRGLPEPTISVRW